MTLSSGVANAMQDLERDLDREDARTAGVPHTQSERGLAWPESRSSPTVGMTHERI